VPITSLKTAGGPYLTFSAGAWCHKTVLYSTGTRALDLEPCLTLSLGRFQSACARVARSSKSLQHVMSGSRHAFPTWCEA
jgi:hypothetical protein